MGLRDIIQMVSRSKKIKKSNATRGSIKIYQDSVYEIGTIPHGGISDWKLRATHLCDNPKVTKLNISDMVEIDIGKRKEINFV